MIFLRIYFMSAQVCFFQCLWFFQKTLSLRVLHAHVEKNQNQFEILKNFHEKNSCLKNQKNLQKSEIFLKDFSKNQKFSKKY